MGLSHASVDPDGIVNFHFAAQSVDIQAAGQPRFSDADFGRRRYAEPRPYRFDPESEPRPDHTYRPGIR